MDYFPMVDNWVQYAIFALYSFWSMYSLKLGIGNAKCFFKIIEFYG